MGKKQCEVYRYHLTANYVDKNGQPAIMAKLQALRSVAAAPTSELLQQQPDDLSGMYRSDTDYIPKMAAALTVLEQRMREGEQTVVFSALHEPLDTLSKRLSMAGVPHDVLDGRVSAAKRGKAAAEFQKGLTKGAKPVMLCGMKAMGEGNSWPLANNVIVLAYDWALDIVLQCIDRVFSRAAPSTGGRAKSKFLSIKTFAADFGESRLSEVTLDELKEWVQDDAWSMRTRINFLTKISQLYRFAILNDWADSNLTERIARPAVDETTPEIFATKEAEQLLSHARQFDLLPFVAIGFFAGVRSAEMLRLTGKSINFEDKTITIGADIAKKRSQRIVDMQPALLAWLQPCKDKLQAGGPIVDQTKLAKSKESLLELAEIKDWRANGLRHSFGSYHLAMFRSAEDTSHQMGNSVDIVHKHYKALVPKAEAERFWGLRPTAEPSQETPQQSNNNAHQQTQSTAIPTNALS